MAREKLIYSKDDIEPYLPPRPRFVILGTMAAINARQIEEHEPPKKPYFFYNNNRNRFWRYMWELFEGNKKPTVLTVKDKKAFCDRWGMAICNIVDEMKIAPSEAKNRTDTIIFEAHQKDRVQTKRLKKGFQMALKELPVYFTCYQKPQLTQLLNDFYTLNKINIQLIEQIHFLHTPAMPGRGNVLDLWKKEFDPVLQS